MGGINAVHKSFYRINHGKTAVLMIHGILGTPRHFDGIISAFPDEFDVYNILLDGHGKGVADFAASSMEKWKTQTRNMLKKLREKYEKIYVAAHSMGTLLAVNEVLSDSRKIEGLILLNVPTAMHLTPKAVENSLKVVFNRVSSEDEEAIFTKNACSIETTPNLLKYITWIPRYAELFRLAYSVGSRIHLLKTPCIAFQSVKDELVSRRSIKILRRNPEIKIIILKHSGHYGYNAKDMTLINERIKKFIKREVPKC